jgi:hypothetical protein
VNGIYIHPVKLFFQRLHVLHDEGDNFAQEIEKHMIAEFSVLELHFITNEHDFGALMFHLLGVIRICRSMQRLKVILKRSQVILCFNYIP